MRQRLRSVLWPALVASGAILPLVPGLLPGRTLAWRDSALLQAPVRALVADSLREGRLPLWNPWEGLGQPLLAQALHAVLHPVSVLTALVSPSIDFLLAALVVTAALGAWAAARSIGIGAASAAVAGLGYGLSGYVLGMTENAHYLTGAATLPWVVAGLRLAGSGGAGWIAGTAAVAAAGLAMDPGALAAGLVGGLVLAADAGGIRDAGGGGASRMARGAGRAAAACLVGLALAAVQLLPTLAWLPQTLRGAASLASGPIEQWALAWTRLPELVSPGLFVGVPRSFHAPVFQDLGASGGVPFPWAPSVFVGAPVLVLALAGARRRTGALLLALAALFLWIALGRQAGATQLLGGIPVWGKLRYWEKMVAPATLFLAMAAACGAQGAGEATGEGGPSGSGRRALLRWALGGAGIAVAATVPVLLGSAAGGARLAYQGRLVAGLAFATASLLALAWWARRPSAGSGWLPLLVLVQSAAAAPFALHVGAAAALQERPPPLAASQPGPRIVTPIQTNAETGEGDGDAIDRTHAIAFRTGRSSSNVAAGIENAEAYTGFGSVRSAVLEGAGPLRWKALRRLGVSHVVAGPIADDEDRRELERTLGPGATPVASGPGGIQAWAVERREWVTVAPAVRALPDTREAARALGAALQHGSPEVIVEAPEAPPAGPGTVISARRSREAVEVVAECGSPCVVVVNDAFAPGWVAEVDGVPAPVLPADVLVRAVPWPAGRHRMVMRYEPPEVRLGIAVSALALAVVLVGALLQARRARARVGRP